MGGDWYWKSHIHLTYWRYWPRFCIQVERNAARDCGVGSPVHCSLAIISCLTRASRNVQEPANALQQEWTRTPRQTIRPLIGSMRRRCTSCISGKGDPTRDLHLYCCTNCALTPTLVWRERENVPWFNCYCFLCFWTCRILKFYDKNEIIHMIAILSVFLFQYPILFVSSI